MKIGVDDAGGINITIDATYPASTSTSNNGNCGATAGQSASQLVNIAMAEEGNVNGE